MTQNRKQSSVFNRIATEMFDPRRVLNAVDSRNTRPVLSNEEGYAGPTTVIEEVLAGIWSESLRVERVGINDNFFALGGHSLLATQVISRVRDLLQVEVPLTVMFKSPTVAGLAEAVEGERGAGRMRGAPPIRPVGRDKELPLSYAQQRLWFIQQLEPESRAYNIPIGVRVRGALDVTTLRQGLQEIVRRHEVLRTRIEEREWGPVQVIDEPGEVDVPVWDISEVEEREREDLAGAIAKEEWLRSFDLEREAVWRGAVVLKGRKEHLLLMCMHHVGSDGWSTGVMVNEFTALYERWRAGRGSVLPELEVQYGDFAVWQREWLKGAVLEEELRYWRGQLGGAAVVELPTDHPRPAIASHRGGKAGLRLSGELTKELKELSRREGVTLFMTLLAAFQVVVGRYAGEEDVAVGTDVANRKWIETEGLIGFFVNQLVLRTDLSGNPCFRELLRRVRETTIGAYGHQDVPFEKLVEELAPERDLSRTPLFQVAVVQQNPAGGDLRAGGLELSGFGGDEGLAKFDLTLFVNEGKEGVSVAAEYATDLYERTSIERLLGHIQVVLEVMVGDGEERVGEVVLLTASERHGVMVEWNDTEWEYEERDFLHKMFEEQAEEAADSVALVYEDEQMSYGGLNEGANRLAHYLRELGVGAEVKVALCMERSVEMIVGVLGVMKAGGAYVPMDPTYPSERLVYMLEDARAAVLLTQSQLRVKPLSRCVTCVELDREWEMMKSYPASNPAIELSGNNLAYVIYTSGSTGKPKGVEVSHENLLNSTLAREYYYEEPVCRFMLLSSIGFDSSVVGVFWTLGTGGMLLLPREGEQRDGREVVELIERYQATHLLCLPSLYRVLLEEKRKGMGGVLRTAIVAGEECLPEVVKEHQRELGETRLYNEYGPTEGTVWTSVYECRGEVERGVPIGRPIRNTRAYIVDRSMEAVVMGHGGELCLGGKGITRGYENRGDETAERYIPDWMSGEEGGRLYRTGDKVRWRVDGELEYVGRVDEQVKVRGHRIELGEIECALGEHRGVRECAVMVREGEGGEKRLVGYVVGREGEVVTGRELREYLRGKLPEYMVPWVWVEMEKLPLTPNGKVDRKGLPAWVVVEERGERGEARTAVEEILAGIWAEVLKQERVGVNENFFELGGHSLLATQVISRVRDVFEVEIALRVMFERPTVAWLAEAVEAERRAGRQRGAPAIARLRREGEVPLSYAQERLWFIQELEPESAAYNLPIGVRLTGDIDISALGQSLEEIVRRHEVLRTRLERRKVRPVQVIEEPSEVRLPIWDASELEEGEREEVRGKIAGEDALRPFDLEHGPGWRAALVRMEAEDSVLLLCMHHVASDGWSADVMVREFTALYEALREGSPSPLAELDVQYGDYAVWQREWLRGEVLEEELGYWRGKLRGAPVLEVPTDHPRPVVGNHEGESVPFKLSSELTQKMRELSRREGVTVFMTVLAGLQMMLGRYAGQEDVVVGTDVANRNRMETEGLIGFFVNQLVMRTDLSGNPTLRDVLRRVRETTLGAYEHQDLPFEKLVEELAPDRDLSRTPLFQVKLVFQNAPGRELRAGGLEVRGFGTEHRLAKFDLVLFFNEGKEVVSGTAEYATDLYEETSIERLLRHARVGLEAMVSDIEQRVEDVGLLTEWERQQVIVEWNDKECEYEQGVCVHELFEEQAELRPDAVAVVSEEGRVSYGVLNEEANRVAHYLRRRGVGREMMVGVMLNRSAELIVATLGILKAGGAYMPLDRKHPSERVRFMLRDGEVEHCIANSSDAEVLRGLVRDVVCFDQHRSEIDAQLSTNPACVNDWENLAYCIYTSGSTGNPNGVMIGHKNVVRLMVNDPAKLNPTGEDVWTMMHSYCFDFSVWEMYGALLHGGAVVVVPEEVRRDPALFAELVIREGVTVVSQTPSYFYRLMEEMREEHGELPIKHIIFGAEALRASALKRFKEGNPETKLINMYGITETTVHVTYHEVSNRETENPGSMIGGPIPTTKTYVVDDRVKAVPIGVTGEIYVGGEGLGRGYLRRPELTAERFVPDGMSNRSGGRLYKSGDLARYTGRGELEYVGRRDHQVKVRGYRVELGDIEAAMIEHPGVKQCAVIVWENEGGERRLAGYVVPVWEKGPSGEELREYLRGKLPEYMVPWAFVELTELPLTPNGKLDRKGLPAPGIGETGSKSEWPRTPVEEIVAGIWGEVLGLERVGVNENFFELGGHSLLATQVISRVRDVLEVEAALRVIFERPTVAGLAEAVESERRTAGLSEAPPIRSVSRDRELPLSFAQQRLWFIHQFEPDSAAYNIPYAVRLRGEFAVSTLHQSLQKISRRHEVLRTRFESRGGRPVQVIDEPREVDVPVWDMSQLEQGEGTKRARAIVGAEAWRPFDLELGPVWRVALVRLGAEDHLLLLCIHHVASDGWSTGVLVRELTHMYEAFRGGGPSSLPELPVQYADFAVWQREWLQGEVLEEQLGYWRRQLADAPVLELPTDRPRPAVASHNGEAVSFVLSAELTQGLRELSRREGVTLFMTLLTAFQLVLGRYAGQEDVVVGTGVANRNRLETEELIGFFVNQLVLRTDLSGNPTFRDLFRRVRETTLGAYEHQNFPFEKLVEELTPERVLRRSPLFQVEFVFQNARHGDVGIAGISFDEFGADYRVAKFDLTLALTEGNDGVRGTAEYATDLYDGSSIERLLGHVRLILQNMIADAAQKIGDVALLTASERQQVFREWNDTEREYGVIPAGSAGVSPARLTNKKHGRRDACVPSRNVHGELLCVHEMFQQQAERTPDAVALVYEEQQMSYAGLNKAANRLAHYLRELRVGAEVRVAVCVERCLEMVAALLAVLKAGGAYVPMDPSYPAERLTYMLEDAGASVLLTQSDVREKFSSTGAQCIELDREWDTISSYTETNPCVRVSGDSLAYVIYTSGSTGRPKGALVDHRGLINLAQSQIQAFEIMPGTRLLQFASIGFDASVSEIFTTLVGGGTLCLASREGALPGSDLLELLASHEISVVTLPPSVLGVLGTRELPALRTLVAAGEACTAEIVDRWAGDRRFINAYGPTEATVCATWGPCSDGAQKPGIGRPLANTELYLLDEWRQTAPVGVWGELHIGGVGLARGYLGMPELTAERFLPNPFSERAGERLYRTGDRGKWRVDGSLEYLDRMDRQEKIRGFRIELGEIETVLGEHRGVQQCAVCVREDEPGTKRLVAYLVASDEAASAAELREYLRGKLPDYMVPSAFVEMDDLPLTGNGKLDRKALPAPTKTPAVGESGEPRTPVEQIVAGIWAEVLGLEGVGVNQNFFELGGHSLLATQVVSRIRDLLDVEVRLRALFERPTVAGLTRAVEAARGEGSRPEAPPIRSVSRQGGLPASFAQQRLWFIHELERENAAYNMPHAVRLRGDLNISALRGSLQEIARRQEVLRTRFESPAGRPVQVIDDLDELELPLREVSDVSENERERYAREIARQEAQRPFDLERGPVWRAALLRLAGDDHVLLLCMHHVVTDDWSMGVMVREFTTLYEALRAGIPSPLSELVVQYADFAVWQREWLQGEALEGQLSYWKRQLAGAPVLELPTDRPRPAVASYRGSRAPFKLSAELTRELRDVSRREGVTLFMTLLAGFQMVLGRYAGQDDVVVGTDVANRNRVEMEGVIGFFVNQLVLRTDLTGNPSFRELLRRVRETTLGAYEHQDVPFEKLVEELSPDRDLSRSPLFQVKLVDQNAPRGDVRVRGLGFNRFGAEPGPARFDLTVFVDEGKERVSGTAGYAMELYEEASIERLLQHVRMGLEAMVANPGRRIADVVLMSEWERQQVIVEWNDKECEYEEQAGVHEMCEQQGQLRPDAVAVVSEEGRVSYGVLNEQANRLAHYLRDLGVGAEVRVAICMERSLEMVVALLGVLKAGGAYVPLDPSYPAERLVYMLDDAQAPVVLTQRRVNTKLPSTLAHCIELDSEWGMIGNYPDTNAKSEVLGSNLAYVIYTSGSTGNPKGVQVSHENLLNSTLAREHYYKEPVYGCVLLSSISFDSSVAGVFWTLGMGGTLLLPSEGQQRDGREVIAIIERHRASHVICLPSLYIVLLKAKRQAEGSSLRTVIVAGEECAPELVKQHQRDLGGTRLYNEYGPTEASVWTTAFECRGDMERGVPIGRPIGNVVAYVMDMNMHPTVMNQPGEIYIGGKGITRGYVNKADLTAERFIPDWVSGETGWRLYRTGDRVRWRRDGELEYLGRLDEQVKVRGHRIELGEIESALGQHSAVKDCGICVREDEAGEKRLVAYVVPSGEAALSGTVLREHLREKLPEYMVPWAFVELKELPLTANGKLDRKALPAPVVAEAADAGEEPRTPVEEIVAGIWAEVLRRDGVGVKQGFFELGGHSLLATQVISRVRDVLEVELPLRVMFETPTVAGLADAVERERRAGRLVEAPPIRVVSRDREQPLSFAQQRLWFIHQLEPESAVYNIPIGVRLKGDLDHLVLRQSLSEVARRHEVMRTRFVTRDGQPVQIIDELGVMDVPIWDVSGLADDERERKAREIAAEETQRPFDFEQGPLWRAALVRIGIEDHVLLLCIHHVASDGWSAVVMIREVTRLYEAFKAGNESPLQDLAVQYADFAVWQREWLQGEALEEQFSYWKRALAGSPVLEIPADRSRPAAPSRRGGVVPFGLSAELTHELKELSRCEGVTLFMTLLAGFQLVLGRYAGQEDVVVGTDVANRNRVETEGLIGFFVNQLVLRTDLRRNPSVSELLRRVRETTLGAYEHQDLPFEKLVEEISPNRDLRRSPLFQVKLVDQNGPGEVLHVHGLELSGFGTDYGLAKFDLTLFLDQGKERLSGIAEYATDLYEETSIERLLAHMKLALKQMVAAPGQRVGEIALLTASERQRVLVEWNDTARDRGELLCVHEIFEKQAEHVPDAVAVVSEEGQLTYRALDERADRLADYLESLGVGPNTLVAICVERSLEMVIGLLGVLKAGGAYVPLDPSYPVDRLTYMLEDARAPALLTQERLVSQLPAYTGKLICLDVNWERRGDWSVTKRERRTSGRDLAYVIHTSGSTGWPKGAMNTHEGIVNRLQWMQEMYGLGSSDRVLQKTTFSFDVSVWELLWPLLTGAAMVMARPGGQADARYLSEVMRREQITTVHFVPSMLESFLDQGAGREWETVERVISSGEALTEKLVRKFREMGGKGLHNLYGPTEAAVDVSYRRCDGCEEGRNVPIGRPISNTQLYVVDRWGQLAAAGTPGELCIGGAAIGRGYWSQEGLTAERFVPDGVSGEEGRRLYRTGDKGRWSRDGELEYLGRLDDQVKVRGYRIELGEIETVLAEHPAVSQCVVIVREDKPGDKRLVCYIVASGENAPSASELREYLRRKLPEYMVPWAFVELTELPLTANGKLNRKALPAPEVEAASEREWPQTPVEEVVAGIWGDVLGLERVGVNENFFELGGYSLLATQVISRVLQVLGVEVPVRVMFERPTVAGLAAAVERNRSACKQPKAPPIQPANRERFLGRS